MEPRVVALFGATSSTSKNVVIAQMAQSSHVHSLYARLLITHTSTLQLAGLRHGGALARLWSPTKRVWAIVGSVQRVTTDQ